MTLPTNWRTQLASDVQRDGLGFEVLDEAGNVVAEVFRYDADHRVGVALFTRLPDSVVADVMARARAALVAFEDGVSLPAAFIMEVPPNGGW